MERNLVEVEAAPAAPRLGSRPARAVILLQLALLAVEMAAVAMTQSPLKITAATMYLAILTQLLFIQAFYSAYHRTASGTTRALLLKITRRRNEGAYISPGGESSLFGNLVVLFVFFWPLAALALDGVLRQPAWTVALWLLLVLFDVLGRSIILQFDHSLQRNFGYNLGWMLGIVMALLFLVAGAAAWGAAYGIWHAIGLLTHAVPRPSDLLATIPPERWHHLVELGGVLALLLGRHFMIVMSQLDKDTHDTGAPGAHEPSL
jgi:hypothetical protein